MDERRYTSIFLSLKRYVLLLLICSFTLIYSCIYPQGIRAAEAAGGDITNPVARVVDLARPAIVRIITTEEGTLTVRFPANNNTIVTFPQGGGKYPLQLSGSGTFISGHGDIITADHVVNPPHDQSLNQSLQALAAKDIADYVNANLRPAFNWTPNTVLNAFSTDNLQGEPHYSQPTSQVFFSTDYAGMITAPDLRSVASRISAPMDRVEKESPPDQKDVAIIHVKLDDTPNVQVSSPSNVVPQDELTIIGFPGNADISQHPATALTPSINKVYVSAIKKSDAGAPLIQVGGNVGHGDSGGPALNSSGNIVGVVSFTTSDISNGTSFFQDSSSAKELINALRLDTRPGRFQQTWTKALNEYAAATPGHWEQASKELRQLSNAYPDFHALDPYITHALEQARQEKVEAAQSESGQMTLPTILLDVIIGVVLTVLLMTVLTMLFEGRRRRRTQAHFRAGSSRTSTIPVMETQSSQESSIASTPSQSQNGSIADTHSLASETTHQSPTIEWQDMTSMTTVQRETTGHRVVMDVQDITKTLPLGHDHIEILKGISFQVLEGEFISIVGPSGSGKSTLLGIIAGLDNPGTGKVLIDGVDITRMTEGELAGVRNNKIGMVFQAFNLIPTLTAQENVEVPLYVGKHAGSPSARAKELLTLVGLSHRLDHRPSQLSGGEQQRVAIARALATDPAIVIADEPTGNLDARNGENVLKLIAELREQTGKTFIIATHDPVVASHADRAIRIVDGKVAAIDSTAGRITQ